MKDGRLRIKRMDAELEQVGADIYGMDYYFKHVRWDREMLGLFEN